MASPDRIANYLPPMTEPRRTEARPQRDQAPPPLREGALHGASDGAPEGTSAGMVRRYHIGKGPPKLYLPACGALCDILWWARRGA